MFIPYPAPPPAPPLEYRVLYVYFYLILNFQVVHTCSDLLHNCYTLEEIEETKLGQLELMRKVFLDLINDTK